MIGDRQAPLSTRGAFRGLDHCSRPGFVLVGRRPVHIGWSTGGYKLLGLGAGRLASRQEDSTEPSLYLGNHSSPLLYGVAKTPSQALCGSIYESQARPLIHNTGQGRLFVKAPLFKTILPLEHHANIAQSKDDFPQADPWHVCTWP